MAEDQEATIAKLLVIDDDAALRRMMKSVLTRAGHEVIEATDGVDGMAKFRAEAPDLIVSDIMMPHRDGIETIQTIRDINAAVAVVAISGGGLRAGELYLSIAKELGADVVLQKPFRAAELAKAVETALGSGRG
ncbi:MAG: response regulator [Caulobacteraceae bacterium]|nr:response regulator [Caulobacteraceae bacterium]